ncbi:MAG TPA: glycosyltransferase [Thermoanaerobaculia bacterium]|nr:glycosyltransferase [Thermoanaerobaculia bacterium]
MDVSVVIPTCNRAASLDALLHDLGDQRGDAAFEVLVVDNRSVDDTPHVVQRRIARDPRIRYLFEHRPGASCARNAGIAAAKAPILAFIDDDVRPRQDWVISIVNAFREHPEVDCIGGRVEPRWSYPPPRWLTRAHWAPLALQVDRGQSRYIDRDHASACLITANFACRAEVFRELGGFASDYRRDEDREFNLRMWRAGKRGLYVDSVVASADVQPERLAKRYHRAWYHVTGASHARLRYRDAIDRDGRLDDGVLARARQFRGVPGFLYREFAGHAARWARHLLTGAWNAAFLDECRLRYLASYVATRWREPRAAAPAVRARVTAPGSR